MSDAQPPAGWYADPQDATQQRYWDGTAWTGHTAPAGGAQATPTGDAVNAGGALPTAAPAWQVPMGAGVGAPTGKKPFFKRTWVIVTAVVVIALIVVGVVFAKGGNHSNALEQAILKDGQQQLQASVSQAYPGATAKITSVQCVETGNTQQYDCHVHFTLTSPDGTQTEKLVQTATGSCDNGATAYHCLWQGTGEPVQDNS
jgi:hypothetical protein